MTDPTINCPHCKKAIKLTEAMAAPMLEAAQKDFETKLQAERGAIEADARKKALAGQAAEMERISRELADSQQLMKEREKKLAEAQAAQAAAAKSQREFEDAKRELELTIEKRVTADIAVAKDAAKKEAEGQLGLKLAEKDNLLESMEKKLAELTQKLEQGSQQTQGEVYELAVEAAVKAAFPTDTIEPVGKGEFGGDMLQRVALAGQEPVGTIIWELKRTKSFSPGWLPKLRGDQRAAKADVALLITHQLPEGIESFGLVDGVWVASPRVAVAVSAVLRQGLLQVAEAKLAADGLEDKAALVYKYLTGNRFKQRMEAIVESFSALQDGLEKERKAVTKTWAYREELHARAIQSAVSMVGELQGIAGKSIKEIGGLDLAQLPGPEKVAA